MRAAGRCSTRRSARPGSARSPARASTSSSGRPCGSPPRTRPRSARRATDTAYTAGRRQRAVRVEPAAAPRARRPRGRRSTCSSRPPPGSSPAACCSGCRPTPRSSERWTSASRSSPRTSRSRPAWLATRAEALGFESRVLPRAHPHPREPRDAVPGRRRAAAGVQPPARPVRRRDPRRGGHRDDPGRPRDHPRAQREPIACAKAVASVDHLSGGRLLFGVGAGWNVEEMRNHGVDPGRRFGQMREHVEAMQAIWRDDEASYAGRHVHFERIWSWPKPVQRPGPPILVGGNGKRRARPRAGLRRPLDAQRGRRRRRAARAHRGAASRADRPDWRHRQRRPVAPGAAGALRGGRRRALRVLRPVGRRRTPSRRRSSACSTPPRRSGSR